MNRFVADILKASNIVFRSRGYLLSGIIGFGIFLTLYAFLLPATYTGGRVGLVSIRLISPKLALFTFLFSALLALIVPFAVYAWREKAKYQKTSSSTVGSFFGSVLPPLLCCSPILPSIAAFASGVFPFAFGVSGVVQGVIATYETQIFIAVVVVLAYSLYQNSKQVIFAEQKICAC